jgi:hypothetical protein
MVQSLPDPLDQGAGIEDTGQSRYSQALGDVPALAASQLAGVFIFLPTCPSSRLLRRPHT